MSNLITHMEQEFRASGLLSGTDPLEEKLVASLRGLIREFAAQDHSGSTASMTLSLFDRLVHYKPLTPLTGDELEWNEVPAEQAGPDGPRFVNKRCSSVLKYADGRAVDVGMLPTYVLPNGMASTRSTDRPPEVTFPYMPGLPPFIAVDASGNPI